MANKTHHKDAILSEIAVDKFPDEFPVAVAVAVAVTVAVMVELIHQTEVLLYVAVAVSAGGESHNPGYEAEAGHHGNKHHPEPNEKIYLLIKQIDWKHTLDGVAVVVSEAAHHEITHGDPGEPG